MEDLSALSFLAAFLAVEDENAAEREATEKRFSIVLPPPPAFFAPSSVGVDEVAAFLDGAAVDIERLLRFESAAGGAGGGAAGGTKIIAAGL